MAFLRADGVGLLPALVVEVASVGLECRQQCHHLTEDLLVGVCELRRPSLERRVVAELHTMQLTTYATKRILGTPIGTP